MKNINRLLKKVLMIVITVSVIASSFFKVNAAQETITLGDAPVTPKYIAGVSFHYKKTTDGKDLYCMDIHKNTARNVTARLVKNSPNINGGLVYILKNGYPNKSFTGDKDKDYYITQTAVWWYLDMTTGSTNLGEQFKTNGSDEHDMRKYVKKLVNAGYKHRNDSIGYTDTKLVIKATGTKDMSLENDYYISSPIKATTLKNVKSYTVTLSGAPKGTKVVKSDGSETTYEKGFVINGKETFRIKVPSKVMKKSSKTELSIKVKAKTSGEVQYMAYEYQPEDSSMQNVALLEETQKGDSSSLTLGIESSKVTVIKIDSNTKQAIAGAKLVLKDSAGNVITRWTSTINGHVIRNLTPGKYVVEEEEPPKGYLLNENKSTFDISNDNKEVTVRFENAPKNVVVNITKIDQETEAPLAGALLAIKDSTGKEITRFTTTEEPYVLTNLENGTYTVEEVSAPAGYIKSDEKISFTIDDNHLSHQITFVNAKEVFVPDTSSVSSIIMLILGIGITGLGIRYIYKNGQKA